MDIQSHHIAVSKTARYYTLGTLDDRTEQIWFVVHGFAQLADKFLGDFEKLNDGRTFVVAPEGLNKFYLKAGKPEVGATWMTRQDRENEIHDYMAYLNQLYDSLDLNEHKAKIIILGFSQGVATVSRWMYNNPRKVDTLIFFAGEPGNELQDRESMAAFNKTKNYFIYGDQDQFIVEQMIADAKAIMPNFEFISFHGKHEINIDLLLQIR